MRHVGSNRVANTVRAESVTHVSGINRYLCNRNRPRWIGLRGQDLNLRPSDYEADSGRITPMRFNDLQRLPKPKSVSSGHSLGTPNCGWSQSASTPCDSALNSTTKSDRSVQAACRGDISRSIRAAASRSAARRSCPACRCCQNSGELPKYRASRSAVSAVTPRLPLTMSLTRVAGT
jgi:hypothetical protein